MSDFDYLFVYGTLRSDSYSDNYRQLIAPNFTLVDRARTPGRLFAIIDYPGMIAAENSADLVIGEVYIFDGGESQLTEIDDYEGCAPHSPQPHLYTRKKQQVSLYNGSKVEAWVYIYNFPVSDDMLIRSGDFLDPL